MCYPFHHAIKHTVVESTSNTSVLIYLMIMLKLELSVAKSSPYNPFNSDHVPDRSSDDQLTLCNGIQSVPQFHYLVSCYHSVVSSVTVYPANYT